MPPPILDWNAVALEANRVDHGKPPREMEEPGPTLSSRALAIVHIAMYDAYFGTTGDKPTYTGVAVSGAPDEDVALAGAAHTALSFLYPSQRPMFDGALATSGAATASPAFAFGLEAAEAILRIRGLDPNANSFYREVDKPYHHRVDPLNRDQGYHGAAYGWAPRFAVRSDHALNSYPDPGSAEYQTAHNQVLDLGRDANSGATTRTPDQTKLGIYWAYDGVPGLGTPPRLYNLIARHVLDVVIRDAPHLIGVSDAELVEALTLMNVAMGDAGILAWREKYVHDLWRPIVGIRKAEPPHPGDAGWRPLGSPRTNMRIGRTGAADDPFTPPFPAYPSGHATFGAAAFQVLRRFLLANFPAKFNFDARAADPIAFTFTSEELDGKSVGQNIPGLGVTPTEDPGVFRRPDAPRTFTGLWHALTENAQSRVPLGVHWEFDAFGSGDAGVYSKNVGGVPLGLNIADDIFANLPLSKPPGPTVSDYHAAALGAQP